jgi:hypothetical protein
MTEWLIIAAIFIAAFWLVPMSVQSMKASRKGRLGDVVGGFADAVDPGRAMIVEEMEKRQNMDGEEADGDDQPIDRKPRA